MNNEIQDPLCSSQVSRLLQAKGFDATYRGVFFITPVTPIDQIAEPIMVKSPTHAVAIEWLRTNFGILNIAPTLEITGTDEWEYGYEIVYLPKIYEVAKRRCPHIERIRSFKEGIGSYQGSFSSPSEATEAALLYTLTNLV